MTGTRDLGVGEGDLLALVLGREVRKRCAGALLDVCEPVGGEVPVRGT